MSYRILVHLLYGDALQYLYGQQEEEEAWQAEGGGFHSPSPSPSLYPLFSDVDKGQRKPSFRPYINPPSLYVQACSNSSQFPPLSPHHATSSEQQHVEVSSHRFIQRPQLPRQAPPSSSSSSLAPPLQEGSPMYLLKQPAHRWHPRRRRLLPLLRPATPPS